MDCVACQLRPQTGIRRQYLRCKLRESHPKPATLDVDTTDTEEGLLRLVGSFPKAKLVLGEVAENLCVRRQIAGVGYPAPDSSTGLHVGGV